MKILITENACIINNKKILSVPFFDRSSRRCTERKLVFLDFLALDASLLVVLGQIVGEFLIWWAWKFLVLPQIGSEELIC